MNNKGLIFLGVGFELLSLCLAGIYLGGKIDAYMGWPGYASIGLILAMLFGWFVHFFVLLKKFEEEEDNAPKS